MGKKLPAIGLLLFCISACGVPADKEMGTCTYLGGCDGDNPHDYSGYNKDAYGSKEVGLCTYLGGCMESNGDE